LIATVPFSLAQAEEIRQSLEPGEQRLAGLSSWFEALDGFLADTAVDGNPEAGYNAWIKAQIDSRLPPAITGTSSNSSMDSMDSTPVVLVSAAQALNELAVLAFGIPSRDDGLIRISYLPAFAAASKTLFETSLTDPLSHFTELHGGANPLRVLLAFLSALNTRDREAFRLLAGLELDSVYKLLEFSRLMDYPVQTIGGIDQSGLVQSADATVGMDSSFPRASIAPAAAKGQLEAEKLLGSWRSSRLRSANLQPGSLARTEAGSEAGKFLAELLDTDHGTVIFNTGWAGERFAKDAEQDLGEAWSAIGRAVAIDLRREAAPWLARRLGIPVAPSFSLEYTVQPAPSNPFKALMTMRVITAGVSYGIPYQVAARALVAASAVYFDDAPVPVRYVEEPFPGLRIYIPRKPSDASKALAELKDDLAAAYPAALSVPPVLLAVPSHVGITHAKMCISLDGAYREAATGARLARQFSAMLHSRGYPDLASAVVHAAEGGKE
jgi:hypothetical protein